MTHEHKFTKGPWYVIPQSNGSAMIAREYETGKQLNPKGLRLIANSLARGDSLTEDEANARLIAAAPELLGALQAMLRRFDFCENFPADHPIAAARAAIAKATGGAQ